METGMKEKISAQDTYAWCMLSIRSKLDYAYDKKKDVLC